MNEVDFSKVGLKMKQLRSERGITHERNSTVQIFGNLFLSSVMSKTIEQSLI